ncbi:MAG: fluoride efflux transporter CrcB [Desulfobulbaceae bacterium]|nr:fluoride efflux transporter CrcB [Desulfobulbaceae bacterium]
MMKMMAIMTGGGLGAAARYGLFMLVQRLTPATFPFGTLAANLLGSFAIGFLWSSFEGSRLGNEWRLFIFTGFLGGFTTFSTFARETTQLFKVGEWKTALAYLTVSNTLGIALVVAGYLLAERINLWPR